jgi:hypothetical protein
MAGTKFRKSLLGGLVVSLAAIPFLISPSWALETRWIGGEGVWNVPTNWDSGVPAPGSDVIIAHPGDDVSYINPGNNPTLNFFRMGVDSDSSETSPPDISLTQEQDILTVKKSHIGSKATANYTQNAGTHRILQDLIMGYDADGNGNYTMMGGALAVGGHEVLGKNGEGYLLQFGATVAPETPLSIQCLPPGPPPPPVGPIQSMGKNLYLGFYEGSQGEMDLYNGNLTVNGSVRVGREGDGLFDQSGGLVKIKGNYFPDPLFSEGPFFPSPANSVTTQRSLKSSSVECLSSTGPGLIVGLGNRGSYHLSDLSIDGTRVEGVLNVATSEIIGSEIPELNKAGIGFFDQFNGIHTISGNLYLAKAKNSEGTFNLDGDPQLGLVDVTGFASVGYLGKGNFYQSRGTVWIKGIDQEANLSGMSPSMTVSRGQSINCSQQQYIGFTVGRGGTGSYFLNDGELQVSRGESIGMLSGSSGTFDQIGGNHYIRGNLIIARDLGSSGRYILRDRDPEPSAEPPSIPSLLQVQGSLLNNEGGIFDFYGGGLQANIINRGTFNIFGTPAAGKRTVEGQFFNYGTLAASGGTAAFTKKFRNYGSYTSTGANNEFTYLYVAPKGFIKTETGDNFAITTGLFNDSTMYAEWSTAAANLVFTGPGRKSFKTGSVKDKGFDQNFAWGSLEIAEGSVQLLGHLYAHEINGVSTTDPNNPAKITNLFGYCGIRVYYDTAVPGLSGKILTNSNGNQVGHFTASGYVSDCN